MLTAMLRYAGLTANQFGEYDLMELHCFLTGFNYVIASVETQSVMLLDASDFSTQTCCLLGL
jgi:hypothetical protein